MDNPDKLASLGT